MKVLKNTPVGFEQATYQKVVSLFGPRVSAETIRANQLPLYLAGAAYLVLHWLRCLGLKGTQLERAQAPTIRVRLLKIGAQIRTTTRRLAGQ